MIQKLHNVIRIAAALVILYAFWLALQPERAPELTPHEIEEIRDAHGEMLDDLNKLRHEYRELKRLDRLYKAGKLWMAHGTNTRHTSAEGSV